MKVNTNIANSTLFKVNIKYMTGEERNELKEALSKNQSISKMDIPELILNQNYVIVNLYPHFTIPYFTEKMIFDETNKGRLFLDKIASVIAIKSDVFMPKSSIKTDDL